MFNFLTWCRCQVTDQLTSA